MRGWLIGAALLMASGTAQAAAPDLSTCERYKPGDEGDNPHRTRTHPLPVPRAAAALVRADMDHWAISTLAGGTVCIDTRWMEVTDDELTFSADGRYLSFGWEGYEAYGHRLVDRSGEGREEETGAVPVFSPSGRRLAAVSLSDAGYGALEGFTVWQADGLVQIGRIEDVPYTTAWQIDRWAGEDCIELSGAALDHAPSDAREVDLAPRTRFVAAELAKPSGPPAWKILLGIETCPKR